MPRSDRTSTAPFLAATLHEGTFQGFIRTFGLLERVMQPHFARFGISGSQWAVLRTLSRAEQENPAGLRQTDLSNRLIIRPPSVTGVVDRLVKMDLIYRETSPDDQRAKIVRLTPKGRALLEGAMTAHREQIERVLSVLSDAEQDQLRSLLGKLWDHLTEMAENQTPDFSPTAREIQADGTK